MNLAEGRPLSVGVTLEDEVAIRKSHPTTLNKTPHLSDWNPRGWLTPILTGPMHEPVHIHRKPWEYGICVHGLTKLGVVRPDSRAIAIGAGTESPLYHFSNHIAEMVATDLYDNEVHEGKPGMLTNPGQYWPHGYREDHLKVLQMAGDDLHLADDEFDFAFCLSSIEHFNGGDRVVQRNALAEMTRVVKPGGIICITTEVILNATSHHEYFTPEEIREIFLEAPGLELVGGPLSMVVSKQCYESPVDVRDPEDIFPSPHIVLTNGEVLWTSLSLFLQKT